MSFEIEEVERLSPAARVEVQAYLVARYLAQREPRQPERRRSMRLKFRKRDWPHTWHDPIALHFRRLRAAIPR